MYLNVTLSLLTDLIKNNKYFLKVIHKTRSNVNSYTKFNQNFILSAKLKNLDLKLNIDLYNLLK